LTGAAIQRRVSILPGWRYNRPGLWEVIRMLLAGLVFLMCLPVVNADQQAEIEQFIRQLGSPRFQERVAAGKRLAAIGEPALEPLRRAARSNRDPEIRHRALGAARVVGKLGAVAGNYYLG